MMQPLQPRFSHMKILSPRSVEIFQPWVSNEYISKIKDTMVMQPYQPWFWDKYTSDDSMVMQPLCTTLIFTRETMSMGLRWVYLGNREGLLVMQPLQPWLSHMKILCPRSVDPLRLWVSNEYVPKIEVTRSNADATLSNGTLATCDFRRIYIIFGVDLIYKVWSEVEDELWLVTSDL